MEDILKSDIFFVVATVGLSLVVIFVGIALFYLIRLVRNIEIISERIMSGAAFLEKRVREGKLLKVLFGKTPARKSSKKGDMV